MKALNFIRTDDRRILWRPDVGDFFLKLYLCLWSYRGTEYPELAELGKMKWESFLETIERNNPELDRLSLIYPLKPYLLYIQRE